MLFEAQTLAPGPGIGVRAMATLRWRSFQSAFFCRLSTEFLSNSSRGKVIDRIAGMG
jgi:hypothetical protein